MLTVKDRKVYMREYMARRRGKKDLAVVPVLAEPPKASSGEPGNTTTHTRGGEARESTPAPEAQPLNAPHSRGGSQFSWDREKYPNRGAWEVAVQRVERAERYARKFPQFVGVGDAKYRDIGWQYENEGIKWVRREESKLA